MRIRSMYVARMCAFAVCLSLLIHQTNQTGNKKHKSIKIWDLNAGVSERLYAKNNKSLKNWGEGLNNGT